MAEHTSKMDIEGEGGDINVQDFRRLSSPMLSSSGQVDPLENQHSFALITCKHQFRCGIAYIYVLTLSTQRIHVD